MSARTQFSKETRKRVLNRFGGACAYCGVAVTPWSLSVDHVTPLHRGGSDDFDNLFPACRSCNHQKMTHTVEEFRAEITAQAERIMGNGRARIAIRTGVLARTGNAAVFYFERTAT